VTDFLWESSNIFNNSNNSC